jgi:Transposase
LSNTKTGVSLGTISKINKELDFNKENNHGGHPSKLSAHDKQSIICQITSGKLDNAVQATQFINNTLTNPVHPQTVRNALKKAGLWSATKKKIPMLKQTHWQRWLKFAQYHENWIVEDWKRVLWSDKTKINQIGSDGKVYVWKQQGELVSGHTTIPTVKHRGG